MESWSTGLIREIRTIQAHNFQNDVACCIRLFQLVDIGTKHQFSGKWTERNYVPKKRIIETEVLLKNCLCHCCLLLQNSQNHRSVSPFLLFSIVCLLFDVEMYTDQWAVCHFAGILVITAWILLQQQKNSHRNERGNISIHSARISYTLFLSMNS